MIMTGLGIAATRAPMWMETASATLEPSWLDTIDFRGKFPGRPLELDDRDYDENLPLFKRMTAEKTLRPLGAASLKDMKDVAKAALEIHVPGAQTLIVLNTVERAKAVYAELERLRKKSATPKLLLIHSRFRPAERQLLNQQLQDKGDATNDRIIIATARIHGMTVVTDDRLILDYAKKGYVLALPC
jgi:CRISPR-associated endonuclease/helicase Cas3